VSIENQEQKALELELWDRISTTTGADRAATFEELSHISYHRDEWKECLSLVECAIEIYTELGKDLYKDDLVHVYEGAAHCLRHLERWGEAAQMYQEIADLEHDTNYANFVCATRHLAGNWFSAGAYEKSLAGHQIALTALDPDANDFTIGIDTLNIGMCFSELKRLKEAIDCYLEARELFKKDKNPTYVNWCDKHLAESYIEILNGPEAKFHAKHFFNFSKVVENSTMEGHACYSLGVALRLSGEFEESVSHLTRALELMTCEEDKDWKAIVGANRELAKALTENGRDVEAAEILARIVTIEETLAD